MRKIKSFKLFESVIDKESIEQEANDNLAYLLDGGELDVKVLKLNGNKEVTKTTPC